MNRLAATPEPPYYTVVFTSHRSEADADGYAEMAARMQLCERNTSSPTRTSIFDFVPFVLFCG